MVMNINEIRKQRLMAEPLSAKALKLARGLYHTYIENEELLVIEIKIQTFFKLLDLHPCNDSLRDIRNLLEELNEPLAVKNFAFRGKTTQLKFIQFCNYEIKTETIIIELSQEYLHAHRYYMLDSFLDK